MQRFRRVRDRDAGRASAPSPGVVTAVRELRRRPGRFTVDVGAVPVAPLTAEIVGQFRLGVGSAVTEAMLSALLANAAATRCHDAALDALARRSRSERELERWLQQREFGAAEIDATLARLAEVGLLDDAAFARGFAHARLVGRGFGARRVAADLRQRGVARHIVDAVLADIREESGGNERAALVAIAERRLRTLRTLEPEVARRRLSAWLIRRGFAVGDTLRAVRDLIP